MSSSSSIRDAAIALGNASCNRIVQRMVSLPRNIIGGFSQVVNHGINLIAPNQHLQHYPAAQHAPMIQEEWAFLATFEQQYGTVHPFFYACRFLDALKIAQDESKLMLVYIHSPEHPFTPDFCRETLCSEVVVQYIDANFVSWGGLVSRGEGIHVANTLKASGFPFCAVVAPASGNNLAVLEQMEGPVSPAELVEILQRTMEEQGVALGFDMAKQDEKRRADHRLREEQDVAYLAALQIDQASERLKKNSITSEVKVHKHENSKQTKPAVRSTVCTDLASPNATTSRNGNAEITQILIRFPNGERKEQSFSSTDKIQAIYHYVDSLGLVAVGSYKLISNFPRKVYGSDEMKMSLQESGLHPKASLFIELL